MKDDVNTTLSCRLGSDGLGSDGLGSNGLSDDGLGLSRLLVSSGLAREMNDVCRGGIGGLL